MLKVVSCLALSLMGLSLTEIKLCLAAWTNFLILHLATIVVNHSLSYAYVV